MTELVVLNAPTGSKPLSEPAPWVHLSPGEPALAFVVEGSRLFELDAELFHRLERRDPAAERELRQAAQCGSSPPSVGDALAEPGAISLNIAQSCNLSCNYCYADEGRFGESAQFMPLEVAVAAVNRLLDRATGRRVTVGFIGGEPFLNRSVLHECVAHASRRARELRTPIGFSVTTNATLLNAEDIQLLREHRFSVSVSLDGSAEVNDRHRRTRQGPGAAARAIAHIQPLLQNPGRARIAARATITRHDLRVAERVHALADAGFSDVGVSPLRTSPAPELVLRSEDWPVLLREMIRAAEVEWTRIQSGQPWRFSNIATAVKQIHQGVARPLPCGSTANYVSVSARGDYFTCHRTIGDPRFYLGSGEADEKRRGQFLAERHVDRQEPCHSCWARYLCGGGCHAEVVHGRSGCDYIRGWLDYCLRFYDRVLRFNSELVAAPQIRRETQGNVYE
jgi:uncharacterized protein